MSTTLVITCPLGHRWSLTPGDHQESSTCRVCPTCGVAIHNPTATDIAANTSTTQAWDVSTGAAIGTVTPGPADTAPSPSKPLAVDEAAAPRLPAIAGYEVQAILGRGGMGVVYKARQVSLNRTVALKMLVAGSYADPQRLARFRTEAEAVAALQHPNIVQVHEVGQSHGVAYFSLEYVDGGCLAAQLDGTPQPAAKAAALIATLAEAVHYAHQHGIIHRDIKPANVLLTADSIPKIADFGLAKRLQEESSQTRTGDIMGTPSYMAPEQAGGITRNIGPACDVYSLGAMLYEMLTGRPPFRGQDAVDTVMLVLSQDPVAPRRLAPRIPRDLETICLKCLEKTPAKRYESAAALADDLHRFLQSRPILARPTRAWERTIKWARRRPAIAALIAVSLLAIVTFAIYAGWKNRQLADSLERTNRQRQRSQDNFEKAFAAAERRINRAGQDTTHVLQEELTFFEEIRDQPGDEPEVSFEKACAAGRAGDIRRDLNDWEQAEQNYEQATRGLSALAEEGFQPTECQRQLAGFYNNWGTLETKRGNLDAAKAKYTQALNIFQTLATQHPDELDYPQQQSTQWLNLGILAGKQKNFDEALEDYGQARKIRQELVDKYSDSASLRHDLALVLYNMAGIYHRVKRDAEAEQMLHQSLDERAKLPPSYAADILYQEGLAGTYGTLADVENSLGKVAESDQATKQAIEIIKGLVKTYPENSRFQQMLGDTFYNHAIYCIQRRDAPGAAADLRAAQESYTSLAKQYPQVPRYANDAEQTRKLLSTIPVNPSPLEPNPPTPQETPNKP